MIGAGMCEHPDGRMAATQDGDGTGYINCLDCRHATPRLTKEEMEGVGLYYGKDNDEDETLRPLARAMLNERGKILGGSRP